MSFKFSPIIFKTVAIFLLCHQLLYTFAQNASFQEVILPVEIKSINSLFTNDKDTLWLATGQGLYSYSNNKFNRYYDENQAKLYCINAIVADKSGNKWYGTYDGIIVKFGQKGILKTTDIKSFCKTDNYLITSLSINQQSERNSPEILLTTSGGEIFSYDTISGLVKNIESPSKGTIYAIQYGYSPTIWLCTSDGFYTKVKNSKWKKKSDIYTAYGLYKNDGKYWAIGRDADKKAVLMLYYNNADEGQPSRFIWKTFNMDKLSNKYIRFYELGFTSAEMVWICCDDGLICYNPLNANINEYRVDKKLEPNPMQHIAVQNDDLIWISTSGKKLFRVDLK
jgi:ligand-binding sensor domain-containing protein